MLQTKTVEPGTLSLLKELMELPILNNFSLVGGTALSLKYGHRISIDLDVFSYEQMDKEQIENTLRSVFSTRLVYENTRAKWGIFCFIDNIKVDIVHYPHPLIANIETIDSIRFYNDKDLMAMKIQAILGRGKKKDFWDIAELLQHYSLEEFITCHKAKYSSQMLGISIPSALGYFTDAEESEEPDTIKPMTWNQVKSIIQKNVRDYLK
jgi:predicted nucleotidyltransferase component of viral defense system